MKHRRNKIFQYVLMAVLIIVFKQGSYAQDEAQEAILSIQLDQLIVKAGKKEKKFLNGFNLSAMKKNDQLFRGRLMDEIFKMRSQTKDTTTKKLCKEYIDLLFDYQMEIDRKNISALLSIFSKIGYWDKFVLNERDTLSSTILMLHIPLTIKNREDSLLRKEVRQMAERERKAGRLRDGPYATIRFQLASRKGEWKDYLLPANEMNPSCKTRILVVK